MSALRSAGMRSSQALRPSLALSLPHRSLCPVAFSSQQRFYAKSGYGDPQGDPKAEQANKQGPNPSADKEHPGPSPPPEGQGSGGGPTKAKAGNEEARKTKSGAKPKIHSEDQPTDLESEDVKKHNKEMENRYGRAHEQVSDKEQPVNKKFWSGKGGVDKD